MKNISPKLQAIIDKNPVSTILRADDPTLDDNLVNISRMKPNGLKLEIPDSFDGYNVWKGLLTPVLNQGSCGSCWAFASVGVLADRFNIQSAGLMYVELSPTKLILCDWLGKEFNIEHPELHSNDISYINREIIKEEACFGNSLLDAFRYLYIIGTCTSECIPYDKKLGTNNLYQKISNFENVEQIPFCHSVAGPLGDMCSNYFIDDELGIEGGDPQRFYRALHFYVLSGTEKYGGNEMELRYNIYRWGPIATAIQIYPDFYTFDFKKNIYEWNGEGSQIGGHAVEITGWGEENGKLYWQVKNSWGKDWGDNGYFKIIRGVNHCHIEENCMAVIPDFFYPIGYDKQISIGIYAESDNMKKQHEKIYTNITVSSGGVEPTTGYTRRIMINMPWLDFTPPINIADLPDWKKFVAGKDASIINRTLYQTAIKKRNSALRYNNQTIYIFISSIFILIISVIILLIFIWKNVKK